MPNYIEMSTLPPTATTDEIENEILFTSVLLSTLDPDADDYHEKKNEYEAILADLEGRLNAPKVPQTPSQSNRAQDQTALSASASASRIFNLPSRESKATPSIARPDSPLQNARPSPHVLPFPHSSKSNASSFEHKKRPHDKTYPSSSSASSKKVRRHSDLTDVSAATTPVSVSSTEHDDLFDDTAASKTFASNREYIMQKMQAAERAREARLEAENRDRELAKALSSETAAITSSSLASSSATQSYFHSNGQWQKPASQLQRQHSNLQQSNAPLHSVVKAEKSSNQPQYSVSRPGNPYSQPHAGSATAFPNSFVSQHPAQSLGYPQNHAPVSDDDDETDSELYESDSDVQEISADQFTSNVLRSVPPFHSTSNFSGPSNQMPGSFPATNSAGPPLHGYQSTSWNLFHSPQNFAQTGNALWTGLSSMAGGLARGMVGQFSGQDTDLSWYGDLGLPGPSEGTRYDYSFEESLHARGLDYMLSDPAKTREDLEALLENIRPDEELPPEMRVGTPEQLKISLMEHQKLGLIWLQQQEESSNKGGILADDMGLGKTIQALALMVTRPSDNRACKTTLIVAPVSLLNQWKREIEQKVHREHALSVYIMHGRSKNVSYNFLCTHDVVITTYGTIGSEYKQRKLYEDRKKTNPNAQPHPSERVTLIGSSCKWHRVILDEAQMIKNKNTKAALGCHRICATYRLCMTGTPMMNNVGELYSLLKFLRISPFNDLERFNREIKNPLEGRFEGARNRAMKQLQGLLKAILLRRTKTSKIDGNPILQLPERTTEVVHAVFDEDQRAFYKAIEDQAILQVSKYLEAGKIGRNYSYVLVRLLRLRQACCHPLMIQDFAQDGPGNMSQEEMNSLVKTLSTEVILRIKETRGQFECPICYDAVENPTIFFPCGHDCCLDCFAKITDPSAAVAVGDERAVARCPECRNPVNDKKVFDYKAFKKVHLPEEEGETDAVAEQVLLEAASDSEMDSDDDSDSIGDDDEDNESVTSQGDLRNFIVPDDEYVKEESSGEVEGDEVDDEGLRFKSSSNKLDKNTKRAGKARIPKDKGKGKAKAKGEKKDTIKRLAALRKEGLRNATAKKKYLRILRRKWVTSAKVEKAMEILGNISSNDPTAKVIVFSQFTSFLDLLEVPVDDQGWKYRRYDGSLSAKERNAAVEAFQDKPNVKLMLVSLKAGNAGLNLTAASHVIIMDPFWNPFIEEQAVDRAHRIGQTRPVTVHRILVEETVEDRILALQEKKRSVINEALDEKAGQSLSRLGLQELRYLFGISNSLPQ